MEIPIREYRDTDYEQLLTLQVDLVDKMSQIDPHKRFRSRKDLNPKKYFDALLHDLSRVYPSNASVGFGEVGERN